MPKYEGIERFPNSKNIILNLNSSTAAKNTDTDNVKYKELSMSIQALKNRKLFLMKNAEKIKQLSVTMQNYIEWRERSHRAYLANKIFNFFIDLNHNLTLYWSKI